MANSRGRSVSTAAVMISPGARSSGQLWAECTPELLLLVLRMLHMLCKLEQVPPANCGKGNACRSPGVVGQQMQDMLRAVMLKRPVQAGVAAQTSDKHAEPFYAVVSPSTIHVLSAGLLWLGSLGLDAQAGQVPVQKHLERVLRPQPC